MQEHIKQRLGVIEPDEYDPDGLFDNLQLFRTNILNASAKLSKYRSKLTSPVYYAAVVLIPWQKWEYFEDHLSEEEFVSARIAVQKLWDMQYKTIDTGVSQLSSSQTLPLPANKSSLLADHMKRSRTARNSLKDEYQRYSARDDDEFFDGGHLVWWKLHQTEYPRLAQMARDIFSIPRMSAEVERLFSSAKLMIPPARNGLEIEQIEAGECIRSWVKNGLVYGDYFEYLLPGLRGNEHFRVQSNG